MNIPIRPTAIVRFDHSACFIVGFPRQDGTNEIKKFEFTNLSAMNKSFKDIPSAIITHYHPGEGMAANGGSK